MATEKENKSKAKTEDIVDVVLTKVLMTSVENYQQALDDYMQLRKERIKTQQLKQRLLEMALDPEQSANLKRQGIIIQL